MKNHDAEVLNPCLKEQNQSYKCLDDNSYDRSKCEVHFDNYNICKKFWGKVYSDRKALGLRPYLPYVEDRPQILAEHYETAYKYIADKNKMAGGDSS